MDKPQTGKQRKAAGQAFSGLMNRDTTHVRAPDRDASTFVHIIGSAYDLHGPVGCCTCCHGGDPKRARRAAHR
jgi:hypothetical protein